MEQGSPNIEGAIQYGIIHNRFSKNTEVTLLETCESQSMHVFIALFKDKLEVRLIY
jgi:hypothetical protein